jgi:hypothetical protein
MIKPATRSGIWVARDKESSDKATVNLKVILKFLKSGIGNQVKLILIADVEA